MSEILQFPRSGKPWEPPPLPSDMDDARRERLRTLYFALYAENKELRSLLANREFELRVIGEEAAALKKDMDDAIRRAGL